MQPAQEALKQLRLLERAIKLATTAHANQVDKAGKPYIEHCLRVMNKVSSFEDKTVAVLHDVIEDTSVTLQQLIRLKYPNHIVTAIEAITKDKFEETYALYLERVIANPIALRVKIADMQDNLDISRITNPTKEDYKRLEKYTKCLPKLLAALNSQE